MEKRSFSLNLRVPINDVWRFIRVVDNWALLMPGYIKHRMVSKSVSIWKFESNFGMLKKIIQLKIRILSWNEPRSIALFLEDHKGRFRGYCNVEAVEKGKERTLIKGSVEIEGKGAIGKMVNSFSQKNILEITDELRERVETLMKVQ